MDKNSEISKLLDEKKNQGSKQRYQVDKVFRKRKDAQKKILIGASCEAT